MFDCQNLIRLSLSPSGTLGQCWRNFLKSFLRYCFHENGMDGRTDGWMDRQKQKASSHGYHWCIKKFHSKISFGKEPHKMCAMWLLRQKQWRMWGSSFLWIPSVNRWIICHLFAIKKQTNLLFVTKPDTEKKHFWCQNQNATKMFCGLKNEETDLL